MTASETAGQKPDHTTLIIFTSTLCAATVAYNATAVITALPEIKTSLDMRPTTLQWVMSLYMLIASSLVAALGRFADMFGHLRVLMFGICFFAVGSLVCLFSFDTALILIGRGIQGVGAAAMFTTSLAVLNKSAPEEKRAALVGLWGAFVAIGMGVGPVVGGLLTDYINWRAVFGLDLVAMVIALPLAIRILRAGGIGDEYHKVPIDYLGFILLILCLATFAYALTHGQEAGWGSMRTLAPLGIAIVSGALFFIHERRAKEPLVNLEFFRKPAYCAATSGMFVVGFALIMFMFYYTLFVQSPNTLDFSAVIAGLSFLAFSGPMFVLCIVVPRVIGNISLRWPVWIGMASLIVGFLLLYFVSGASSYGDIWWRMAILGIAMGLLFPLMPRVGLKVLPDKDSGQGSGVINTCLYFGATVGTAAGGIAEGLSKRSTFDPVIAKLSLSPQEHERLVDLLAHGGQSLFDKTLESVAAKTSVNVPQLLQTADGASFDSAMLVGLVISIIGLVTLFLLTQLSRAK